MLHATRKTVAIIAVIFILAIAIAIAQASSSWTMFRHDPAHSGTDEVCEGKRDLDDDD